MVPHPSWVLVVSEETIWIGHMGKSTEDNRLYNPFLLFRTFSHTPILGLKELCLFWRH